MQNTRSSDLFLYGSIGFQIVSHRSESGEYNSIHRKEKDMGKTFKKFLVMLVALSMVFTMTAMPVYADDTAIDQETESAVLTETVENDAAVENTEEPAVTETATEETQPAVTEEPQVVIPEAPTAETETETTVPEETVIPQENITPAENTETSENAEEVAIETVPVEVVAEETNAITEKVSNAVVKLAAANEAEETVVELDYTGDVVKICENGVENEYKMLARQDGSKEEGLLDDEELTKDISINEGTFDFTVPVEKCGKAIPVVPFKEDGTPGSKQCYLCIPPQDKIPAAEDPTPVDPSQDDVVGTELAITNKATMFKVVNATLTTEKGQEYLVFVMNSSGYHEVFKGTKTQAIANGDGSKDKGNNTWIHGSVNSAGKWQFKLPLTKGESYVPITSISDRNYQTYLSGKGALADVFYGKQLKIDRTAKTLLVEDYNAADDKVTPDSEKPVPEEKTTPSDTNESSYAPAVDSSTTLPDGVYTPDSFSWSGGTGKLTISCTQITVKDGQAYATIVFSSDKVDQLKANGSIYYKEGSGLSIFTIPVNLNANNTIVGRTTAMSQPHWVEYTIYIGLAENEEQAEKAKEAKKDAAEAKTKLMDKAPAIVGLEAKEDQPEIEYSKYFRIFEYENDVKMISIDISEKTALDEEYTENAKKAAAASESKEQVQYDENGKAISKSKEEYTAELYKNKVVNYLLVPEDFEIPAGLDKEYIIVTVPSDKTFMASDEVISMMEELDCLDAITLLAMDEKDVKNDTLKKAIKDEKIKLAGNLEKPDYAKVVKEESTLAVLPGSVLPEEIDKNAKDKDKEKLEKEAKEKQEALEKIESRFAALAVPVVIDRSAQEEEELAQAEWVKVYGAFFGCEEEAEKIFEKKVKEAEKNGKN